MANPTTYFGWVMPTSSSLVTNLPADFNTFGQGVDTSMQDLLGGTTGQVLSKTSNTNMDFTWVTPTDQTPLTTKGDLFTFTTVDARLGVGTNGQVLTADSTAATGLKWATASGGGKVLQVVNATYATQTSTSSNTFSDTGITATITPSSATSKVMVIVSFAFGKSDQNANSRGNLKFLRDATTVGGGQTSFLRTSSATFQTIQYATSFVDSPASTSALVYKVQFSSLSSLAAITICEDNNQANIQLLEIGA